MAADLTPRFRRIRSMGELRARRRGHGPFQATRLWNSIIQALKRNVEVKSRRQHLRTYSSCFTGADAVDVVLCHLMQNMYLSSHDISRNKGIQLCQALMDHKVFEPVGSKIFKSESDFVFEDSNSQFYRFLESKHPSRESEGGKERRSRSGHASTICNPSALDTANEKLNQLLHCICDHPNAHGNPTVNKPTSAVSQKDIENVWKQQVMVRLLQLIDIPVLEDILEPPVKTEHKTHFSDLIVSNTFLDREILQTLHLPKLDRWLASAVECLEYFPDQQIVMLSQQLPPSTNPTDDLDLHKKMLFEVIAKYYTQERDLFFDSRLIKMLAGIVELLECGKQTQALEAIQLFLRLLVPNAREELRRLATFLAMAADACDCKLQKQFDNKTVVSRTLTKILLPNPAISKVQSQQFVVFLLENCHELFKTPLALLDLISTKLRNLENGDDPDAFSGFTFCHRFTLEEFEEQRYICTNKELQHLIEAINRNHAFPDKKKKKLMKDFQKYHPSHFNNPLQD